MGAPTDVTGRGGVRGLTSHDDGHALTGTLPLPTHLHESFHRFLCVYTFISLLTVYIFWSFFHVPGCHRWYCACMLVVVLWLMVYVGANGPPSAELRRSRIDLVCTSLQAVHATLSMLSLHSMLPKLGIFCAARCACNPVSPIPPLFKKALCTC